MPGQRRIDERARCCASLQRAFAWHGHDPRALRPARHRTKEVLLLQPASTFLPSTETWAPDFAVKQPQRRPVRPLPSFSRAASRVARRPSPLGKAGQPRRSVLRVRLCSWHAGRGVDPKCKGRLPVPRVPTSSQRAAYAAPLGAPALFLGCFADSPLANCRLLPLVPAVSSGPLMFKLQMGVRKRGDKPDPLPGLPQAHKSVTSPRRPSRASRQRSRPTGFETAKKEAGR